MKKRNKVKGIVEGSIAGNAGKALLLKAINLKEEGIELKLDKKGKVLFQSKPAGELVSATADSLISDGYEIKRIIPLEINGNGNFKVNIELEKEFDIGGDDDLSEDELSKLEKRYSFLDDNGIKLSPRLEEKWLSFKGDVIPKFKGVYRDNNKILQQLMVEIASTGSILLVGPKATGKNTLADDLSSLFFKEVRELQINAFTSNEEILGLHTIKAKEKIINEEAVNTAIQQFAELMGKSLTEKNVSEIPNTANFMPLLEAMKNNETEVVFEPSEVIKAMENGDFLVLDEINTGNPQVLSLLNPILDDRRRIAVPGYGTVVAHPEFRVIGTMNQGYAGTVDMNEATESRFNKYFLKPSDSIAPVLRRVVPEATDKNIEILDRVYKKTMNTIQSGQISDRALNIRAFIETLKKTLWGVDLKDALLTVINSSNIEEERITVKEHIDMIL